MDQSKALVGEYEDGRVEVYDRGEPVGFHGIAEPIRELAEPRQAAAETIRVKNKAKPDHPWRWGYEMRMARLSTVPPLSSVLPLRPKPQGYAPGRRTTE
jgi:hypothetical protein